MISWDVKTQSLNTELAQHSQWPVPASGLTLQCPEENFPVVAALSDIIRYCNDRIQLTQVPDYQGAENGLQFENNGTVTKVGAAVDAGLVPFQKAVDAGVDLLIVHHGLFWDPAYPITETRYQKYKFCIENNLAVYSAHLPLDCHREIGNNALLAKELQLKTLNWFLEFEGNHIGLIAEGGIDRNEIKQRLSDLFSDGITSIEKGSNCPQKIAVVSGSGASAISHLSDAGVDTLITGEVKQNSFNQAEEAGLNLYLCGHYATETFGVAALAGEVAGKFDLEWEFIKTDCPL
ncbi:MAG: Nif3-like dinuclear metal center hexameric protein [Verrucomicrobia bacterium]|nr:Nif3-like dinuclear metal center hexameric protein [Verrucomicrobiota bacterium]